MPAILRALDAHEEESIWQSFDPRVVGWLRPET